MQSIQDDYGLGRACKGAKYTVRSKSSRTKAIKTKKKRRVFFLFIYSKQDPLDAKHRLARVSNFFMATEKSSAEILFSWSVTAF